ncbi:MAG: FAD binding domain-containing protein [bacterium]|nr:FAD binding domain-containing protein [bacterium]MBU1918943.1 FAD binding domain-containing protein [bacterium]
MVLEFYKPTSITEAIALKNKLGSEALYLAGGTEVNNLFFPVKPKYLISLEGIGLKAIEETDEAIHFGANVLLQDLLENNLTPDFLKVAIKRLVNKNIRNMATLGGHVASNKSCSDIIPTLIACKAALEVVTENETKSILLKDYVTHEKTDLITKIIISKKVLNRTVVSNNYCRSANDVSILNVAISYVKEGANIREPIVVVGGVAKHVICLTAVEEALDGKEMPVREDLEKLVSDNVSPITDIRGTAAFKKYEVGVLAASLLFNN